jgi:hypothetical protein
MDKVVAVFSSFEEAERAEDAHYASMSPAERIDILLDLIARYRESLGETAEGFARVHRVTELSRG